MTPHPVQSATEQTFGVETASLDSLQSTKLRRVDSRMDLHYALPIKTDWGKADLQIVSLPSSRRSSTHMYKANPKPSPQHHMESAQSATSYLFSVVDPSAPVDKEDLRRRRKHVMDVYNERGAPSHQVGNKRKRPAPVLLDPSILPSTSKLDPEGSLPKENPRCTPRDRGTSTCTSTSASRNGKLTMSQDEPAPRFVPVDNGMVVPMAQAAPEAPVYLNTIWQHVPFPLSPLGRQLNAFNVLPDLQGQMVNIYKLKHECGAHFGSGGIVKHWLPSLMQARHAFLSTICISAAHDEIMAYHLSPNRSLPRTDITVRMTIRSEMMRLINMCISDPQLQAHDTTIIAVLQILTSEIMDEGTSYLKVHAKGLGELIKQRGGLNELGIKVGGGESLIALVIVVTMYLIAVLRETEVEPTYRQFCDRIHQTTHWPRRDSVAQSPLVSLGKLAYTSQNCRSQFKETVKVLDQVEGLMHAFSENFMTRVSQDDQCRMFSVIQSFDQRCRDDRSSQDSRRYEVVRLTSLLLGYAMTEHMPLSIASQRLQELGFGRRSGEPPTAITKPPFVQIRDALVRTEIDTLWSPMSGVLFWVCLIAGAAASKATPLNPQQEMSGDEVEANECRKFFCAVAVRCMIKLVFDDPNTILESLRRMNRIQMRLHIRYYDLPDPGIVPADGREGQGPAQGPQPPIGILDYAWEFINLPPDRELPFTSSAPDAVSGA